MARLRFELFALTLMFHGMPTVPALRAANSKLLIVSPHNESIRIEFANGFSHWHQERYGAAIAVEWRDMGGTSDSLRFVLSEFEKRPNGIGLDLFFGGGAEPCLIFAERGLTEIWKAPQTVLDGIPRNLGGIDLYDPRHRWYGAALSSFGILQNLAVQRRVGLPAIDRWEQLADSRLAGWVGAGDPRNSGTMNNMYEAFLQARGWEKGWAMLTEIAGNVRHFDRISSTTAKEVAAGETACAFAIDFYGFSQIAAAGRDRLRFTLPGDFTAVSPDSIAILRGAPNLETAKRFIEFVIGEEGQRLWFLPKGHPGGPVRHSIERMSVRPDFYARYQGISNIEISPFSINRPFIYSSQTAQRRRDIVAGLFGALLVDLHPELKRAWRVLCRRGLPPAERVRLGTMPVNEAEAFQLAQGQWKDAAARNRVKLEWQKWAKEKYSTIEHGLAD